LHTASFLTTNSSSVNQLGRAPSPATNSKENDNDQRLQPHAVFNGSGLGIPRCVL
jgi:hypothetical protein